MRMTGCFRDSGLFNNVHQLETLSLLYLHNRLIPASEKAFPATLKKLKLKRTFLSWSCLDIIAELTNLEVLKLMADACHGEEWYPNVKGFTQLKLLLIVFTNLKYWKATYDNFPVLESLGLRHSGWLKEIPIEFAEINSLQLIELTGCLSITWGICCTNSTRTRRSRKHPCGCSYLLSINTHVKEDLISTKYRGFFEQLLENRRQGEDEQQEYSIGFYPIWGV
ncbi:hypothetical protein P3S68_008681 [Capsicum galapagoense]